MMILWVFCFAAWTSSLNLTLDFGRDASNGGFIFVCFLTGLLSGLQHNTQELPPTEPIVDPDPLKQFGAHFDGVKLMINRNKW